MKKYHIYLDIIHGIEEIKNIHNKLYKDILKTDKGKNYKFIHHITLGTIDKIKNDIFIEEFETIKRYIVFKEWAKWKNGGHYMKDK